MGDLSFQNLDIAIFGIGVKKILPLCLNSWPIVRATFHTTFPDACFQILEPEHPLL